MIAGYAKILKCPPAVKSKNLLQCITSWSPGWKRWPLVSRMSSSKTPFQSALLMLSKTGRRKIWTYFCTPQFWPPNSSDYYFWAVIELTNSNKSHHNIVDFLKVTICDVVAEINPEAVVKVCKRFQSRLETMIDTKDRFIEWNWCCMILWSKKFY